MQRSQGFTLIEISIALVIIGLIVAGILTGRDLIRQSEVRAIISDIEKFKSATNTFFGKYNALPGDIPNATAYWGTDAACPATPYNTVPKQATCDGNGDGKVGTNLTADYYEVNRYWQHLANANLIQGQFTGVGQGTGYLGDTYAVPNVNIPAGPLSNTGYAAFGWYNVPTFSSYFQATFYKMVIFYGSVSGTDVTDGAALTPLQLYSLDHKIDDGTPGLGKVQTFTPSWRPNCATNSDPATAIYNISYTGVACSIIFLMDF